MENEVIKRYKVGFFDVYKTFYGHLFILFLAGFYFTHSITSPYLYGVFIFLVLVSAGLVFNTSRETEIVIYDDMIRFIVPPESDIIYFKDIKEIVCKNILGFPFINKICFVKNDGTVYESRIQNLFFVHIFLAQQQTRMNYMPLVNFPNKHILKDIIGRALNVNPEINLNKEITKYCGNDLQKRINPEDAEIKNINIFIPRGVRNLFIMSIFSMIITSIAKIILSFVPYPIYFTAFIYFFLKGKIITFKDKLVLENFADHIIIPYNDISKITITRDTLFNFYETVCIYNKNQYYKFYIFNHTELNVIINNILNVVPTIELVANNSKITVKMEGQGYAVLK